MSSAVAKKLANGDDRPLKVLFVNDHLGAPDGNIHGASTWFYNVVRHFDKRYVDSYMAILGPDHPFQKEMTSIGCPPIIFNRKPFDCRALFDLIGVIRSKQIDVLHVSAMRGMFFGRIAGRICGVPTIVHFHDTKRPNMLIGLLQRCVSRWTDAAICVSSDVTDIAARYFGIRKNRSMVFHNAIAVEKFAATGTEEGSAVRADLGIPHDAQVVGIIGRIVPAKGHAVLINAMKQVRETCPKAKLLVVGSGPHSAECESLVHTLKLNEHVCFAGQRRDIPAIISACDLVALPSLGDEGCPMTCIESIAGGTPVIVTRDSGFNDVIVDGEAGLIVTPGDPSALADSIVRLFTDPQLLQTLQSGCVSARADFDINNYVETLEGVYKRLLAGEPLADHKNDASDQPPMAH